VKKLNCIRHLWPLDAFSRLLVGPKCICGRGEPHEGAYSAPPDPLAWWPGGEGVQCPLPKNPSSAIGLQPRISALRALGARRKDMGSVSNQNCCKGFCFTEKVEKHCFGVYTPCVVWLCYATEHSRLVPVPSFKLSVFKPWTAEEEWFDDAERYKAGSRRSGQPSTRPRWCRQRSTTVPILV